MKASLLLTAIASTLLLATPALAANGAPPGVSQTTSSTAQSANGEASRHVGRHTEYRRAQYKLKELGIYRGPVTGRRNETFVKALETFQTSHHIAPTGRLTRETMHALGA